MNDLFSATDPVNAERDEITAKWADKPIDELLKAKVESDLYIKTLERQKDELRTDYLKQREELLAKAKFEELIDRYENTNKDLPAALPLAAEVREPKFDPKELDNLVSSRIEEARIRERQATNIEQVELKLKERFGDQYRAALRDTGLSEKRINEIAAESPEAIYRLVGLNDKQESFQAPPRSGQRSDNFAPQGQTKRNWSYYQELKKTNPTLYLDNKIAVQMHNDVIEMGESAFYGQNK